MYLYKVSTHSCFAASSPVETKFGYKVWDRTISVSVGREPSFPFDIQVRQDSATTQARRVVKMGFIHIDDIRGQHEHLNGSADVLAKDQPNGIGTRSFKVAGLIADQVSTPTGMREQIVLLSWLIVLLRTREDGRISYEWAYQTQGYSPNGEVVNKLSTEEVLPRLQDNVGDSLAAISRHIENVKGNLTAESSSMSLLLSTGSLLKSSDSAKNDVREPLDSFI